MGEEKKKSETYRPYRYPCPECGAPMRYDPALQALICEACGVTLKKAQYYEVIGRIRDYVRDALRPRVLSEEEKRRREYLRWWLSKKEEK